ncbi:MAG: hypothetical protein IKP17_05085 [Oscillospiraceae bacterium]|nr:hypothetical protein [Oscillospiraceae bacterium]MBR4692111.1 hypothetical protein [Oscillospiraceae bacterium]
MKKERSEKKEIRSILMGRTVLLEDGRLAVPEPGAFLVPVGVTDGAGAVRFFGIRGTTRRYTGESGEEDLLPAARDRMGSLGRALYLREQPETAACLIRYLLTKPAVLTFRREEGQWALTAWTGRGLLSWISRLRALAAFEKDFAEELRPAAEPKVKKSKKGRRKGKDRQASEGSREEAPVENGQAPEEYWQEAPVENRQASEGSREEAPVENGQAPEGYWEEAPGENWQAPEGYWEEAPGENWQNPEGYWEEAPEENWQNPEGHWEEAPGGNWQNPEGYWEEAPVENGQAPEGYWQEAPAENWQTPEATEEEDTQA